MSYYSEQVKNVKTRKEDIWKCLHSELQTEELLVCESSGPFTHTEAHDLKYTE